MASKEKFHIYRLDEKTGKIEWMSVMEPGVYYTVGDGEPVLCSFDPKKPFRTIAPLDFSPPENSSLS